MGLFAEYVIKLFNLISPRQCVMCGCRLSIGEKLICTACNLKLPRTGYSAKPYDNYMAHIFWGRLPIERAVALFFFRAHSDSSNIIYSIKYFGHPEAGAFMGRMAANEFRLNGFFEGIDAIVPVPLARKRQRERGYNQSMEIARGVSEITHLPIISNAVIRKSFAASQTRMNRWQRYENVKDVFVLKDGSSLTGKHILIIDDVVTTGATVISCATELQKGGASKFSVLSLGFAKQ